MAREKKRALVVGLNNYALRPLGSCVNDATEIAELLSSNETDGTNFCAKLVSDETQDVTASGLLGDLKALFASPFANTVLFYFAGHGVFDRDTGAGHLITRDREGEARGVALSEIMGLAENAHAKGLVKSTVIILDCCQSGSLGETVLGDASNIGKGMTILTSCDRDENASNDATHGVFSRILIDALGGAAADIQGYITPASIYSHIDQLLSSWSGQRPIYKANVQEFVSVRRAAPRIPDDTLKSLPAWFEKEDTHYALDPSYEPEIPDYVAGLFDLEERERNQEIFAQLQICNRNGLIAPEGTKHMFHAAIYSKACRLTELGKYYWRLAKQKVI